jgi:hypothetical protein
MNTKLTALSVALFTLGLGLGACDAQEPDVDEEEMLDDDDAEVEAELDPETTFYTRTRVVALPDGTFEVSVDKVSLAQQIAEREAEEAGLSLEEYAALELGESRFGGEFSAALSKPSGSLVRSRTFASGRTPATLGTFSASQVREARTFRHG